MMKMLIQTFSSQNSFKHNQQKKTFKIITLCSLYLIVSWKKLFYRDRFNSMQLTLQNLTILEIIVTFGPIFWSASKYCNKRKKHIPSVRLYSMRAQIKSFPYSESLRMTDVRKERYMAMSNQFHVLRSQLRILYQMEPWFLVTTYTRKWMQTSQHQFIHINDTF